MAMISLPMQYATTSDGVRIAYVSHGDGPPLVWASNIFGEAGGSGFGFQHTREVTDRLVALGWRVIRYDHRGMGASDRDVEDLSLDGRVRDLAAVVGHLGLNRFALAGIDVGAVTAVAYAVQHHALVSHLILLSPWASGARYLAIPELRAANAATTASDREWKVFANIHGSVATGFKDSEFVRQGTEGFLESTSPSGFAAFNAATACIDITSLLPQVTVPTLVTHEPAFAFGSFELCQEVATGIRGAQFVIINDNSIAGLVHDENIVAIDRFLRSGTATGFTSRASSDANKNLPAASNGLTPREVQVLRQVAAGSTNKEIAGELGVAVSTVERHLVNLYTKIGARGRADAIAYALRHRLDAPPV
jgi:pimeloyl-ACP methyl ester carboxylesterase/DNA-binding CsgD family transcriptional regulator